MYTDINLHDDFDWYFYQKEEPACLFSCLSFLFSGLRVLWQDL